MKRTTVRLEDPLLERAKRYAAATGQTLTTVISTSLKEKLDHAERLFDEPVKLVTYGSGGLRPGVDLSDRGAVLDLMDGIE